ncbi:MAG: response regulator [Deltaproteobacteria bacterium]|nr:response regulator [Deltaproteobacteria bacterium]
MSREDRPRRAGEGAIPEAMSVGATSGLTAIDRARRGDVGAVRVLVIGRGRLRVIEAARAIGFGVRVVAPDAGRDLEDAALARDHHAVLVDADADADAEELVEQLAELAPNVPIVVVGDAPSDGANSHWIDAGADDYLAMADVRTTLRRAVEAAIARGRARELRRRLEHADRLAAVGKLAAGVAHEVNNPAAYVLMNLRTCREHVGELRALDSGAGRDDDGAPSPVAALLDEMAEMLDDNVRGVERIVAIVHALRSYARSDADEVATVEVATVCREAAALTAAQLRTRARFVLEVEPGVCVHADPRRLCQVLVNLLVNAGDAIPVGERDHRIEVVAQRRGDWASIRVSDTGTGIPASIRGRIFEPFFSTKPRGHGSGLGLAIARDIIDRYGGRIDVESTVGHGSRFEIVLPIDVVTEAPEVHDAAIARWPRARLLVIDDELSLTKALGRQLRRHHEVAIANDGASALELAERHRFDVVLCDLMMPDMDGLAVHDALGRCAPELAERVVFMSGSAYASELHRVVQARGLPLVHKPTPLVALLDAIEGARARAG